MMTKGTWIEIDGEHINLAVATCILPVNPMWNDGFRILHGTRFTQFEIGDKPPDTDVVATKRFDYLTRVAVLIRRYLHDNRLVDISLPSHQEDY